MTDVAILKPETQYLLEIRRGFVDWKIPFPILTTEEEAYLPQTQGNPEIKATNSTPEISSSAAPIASVVTKHLKVIYESLQQRDLGSATRDFRGLARILGRLRHFSSFLAEPSLVAAYCRILLWFLRAAEEEKKRLEVGEERRSEKEKRNAERGSDWAASELGSLLGRRGFNRLLPHAKYFGFRVDDFEAFLRRRQLPKRPQRARDGHVVASPPPPPPPPLDGQTLGLIEDFLVRSLRIFADGKETGSAAAALKRWLGEEGKNHEEEEEGDESDDDSKASKESRRFVLARRDSPHVAVALLFLAEELERNFPLDDYDVDFRLFRETLSTFLDSSVEEASVAMRSTKKLEGGAEGSKKTKIKGVSRKKSNIDDDITDPLESLAREALDPEKPSKLDLLFATLTSTDTSDDEIDRLLRLLLVDGGLPAALKSENKKRIVVMFINVKWSVRARPVVETYVEVMVNVLISNLWAVKDLLGVIAKLFTIPKTDVGFLDKSGEGGGGGRPNAFEEELERRRRHDAQFNQTHFVLHAIMHRIPGARQHLIPIMEKAFPYRKFPTYTQECFVLNLLRVSDYLPELRPRILLLLFQRLAAIDVVSSRADIMEKDYDGTASTTRSGWTSPPPMLRVNNNNDEASSSSSLSTACDDGFYSVSARVTLNDGSPSMTHEYAATLDRLLLILFQWITRHWEASKRTRTTKPESTNDLSSTSLHSLSFSSSVASSPVPSSRSPSNVPASSLPSSLPSLPSASSTMTPPPRDVSSTSSNDEGFNCLWRQLLSVFQTTVLPSTTTSHLQFVLFYVSGLSRALTDAFLDFLWKRARDATQPEVIRRAAACYLASFVARANFCNDLTITAVFGNMLAWADRYCGKTEAGIDAPSSSTRGSTARSSFSWSSHFSRSSNRDAVFHLVAQSLFYIVIFRHQKLFINSQALLSIGVKLKRIIDSPLNPLRYCLESVADHFAIVCSSYQLIDCFPIINMNRRTRVPQADGRVFHDDDDSEEGRQTLQGAFFPFEPYLLSHSGIYVNGNNSYLEYEGVCLGARRRRRTGIYCICKRTIWMGSPSPHPKYIEGVCLGARSAEEKEEKMDIPESTIDDHDGSGAGLISSSARTKERIDSLSFDDDDDFNLLNEMILDF